MRLLFFVSNRPARIMFLEMIGRSSHDGWFPEVFRSGSNHVNCEISSLAVCDHQRHSLEPQRGCRCHHPLNQRRVWWNSALGPSPQGPIVSVNYSPWCVRKARRLYSQNLRLHRHIPHSWPHGCEDVNTITFFICHILRYLLNCTTGKVALQTERCRQRSPGNVL